MIIMLILLSSFTTSLALDQFEIDFGEEKDGQEWRIINDGVMGGLSKGYVKFEDDRLLFNGTVSLENNGGFTSFKSPFQRKDLSNFNTVEIKMRATGQKMAMTLETSRVWFRPYFKMNIPASEDWQVITMNLYEFDRYQVGRNMGEKMTKDALEETIRIGFTTNDKKAGPFEMEVEYIKFK